MTVAILVVEEDKSFGRFLESTLTAAGYQTVLLPDRSQAAAWLQKQSFGLAIINLDQQNPNDPPLLQTIQQHQPDCPIILVTDKPTLETAVEAVRFGVFDYLATPLNKQDLLQVTAKAIRPPPVEKPRQDQTASRNIVASLSDAIVTIDDQGRFTHFNPAALEHFGLPASVIGQTLAQLEPPCGHNCLDLLRDVLDHKGPVERYRQQCQNPAHPGQIFSARCLPLVNDQGLFTGAVLVLRKETRFTRKEPELREGSIYHNIVGTSPEMRRLYLLLDKLAKVNSTVLLQGESGTGKELVAEALHYKGARCRRPFVRVNCAGLSETLLDSELFGHAKGAFTGAIKDRCGRFQMAQGGTILLDEIGDISPGLQLKLLRVLQEKEIERLGDATPIPVDVRIIAATHQDLREKIRLGLFREDLYFRLKVVHLFMPPLRQRASDIPLLVDYFVDTYSQQFNKVIIGVSEKVMEIFYHYSWPGNVRELKHMLEHAFIFNESGLIDVDDLPAEVLSHALPTVPTGPDLHPSEKQQLIATMNRTGGNKARAARELNISRQTLYRKLSHFKIDLD